MESSTYGSDLVAMIIVNALVIALSYRLTILGVPVNVTSPVYGNNLSVISKLLSSLQWPE